MPMRRFILFLGLVSMSSTAEILPPHISPELGVAATEADIAALTPNIFPNGKGLPTGSGSVMEGEALYTQHCLSCHGVQGQNGINDPLVGGHGLLSTDEAVRTLGSYWPHATTIFDYINRAMPYRQPGSLTTDEVYGLTAYLLYLNQLIDADAILDAQRLNKIVMPNHGNFVWAIKPGDTQ